MHILVNQEAKVLCSSPQAEALQAAGHVPDHVIVLAAPQPILADRARHRLVDPVTRHNYHIPSVPGALSAPITPTLPDGSPDAAMAARLVPRGDDSVPNVQHRLTVWTKHARSNSSWLRCVVPCSHNCDAFSHLEVDHFRLQKRLALIHNTFHKSGVHFAAQPLNCV